MLTTKTLNTKGQTFIEMTVVISVGILVVSGLVFATISSLRNANFAKNQAQVTKLAQEGIERVRGIRDQDGTVNFSYNGNTTNNFSDLYSVKMSDTCNPCEFNINTTKTGLNYNTPKEVIGDFTRVIAISDDTNFETEKNVAVTVTWESPAGSHKSKLETILTKK